jgi:drug/metabolite transporter superfamily protein YnfA
VTALVSLLLLFLAAVLEAGGDALMRAGLRSAVPLRFAFLLAGAAFLFVYGYTVNAPRWDFGRLLGVYVVLFFIVAQLIAWLGFRQPPSPATLLGGAFILAGGLIVFARG